LRVDKVKYRGDERVYFIESSDSIVTLIPINGAGNSTRIRVELWEDSPSFIKDMYKNPDEKSSLDSVKFLKLN
jgi:hypothetical protein